MKRFMGDKYSESYKKKQKRVPYKVVKGGDNDTPRVDIDGRQYTPQEVIGNDSSENEENC